MQEAKILSELNHPNLVRLFEFGAIEEGVFFMVLEFVQGECLLKRIQRKGRLSMEEAIRITREAAMGLHSAHQLGIVHRDISPDNILLVRDVSGTEVTKVIDFGIAKALLESQKFTATNVFIGKPEYCSPEQTGITEEASSIDQRSDIYSLGVTFFQMLSGRLPFYASTPQGYLVKHASEKPQSILSYFIPGEVPEELDHLLRKALAKKPEDRYATMAELVQDLNAIETAAGRIYRTRAIEDPQGSFQQFFENGKQCFDRLDWEEAIRWWNKANGISADPVLHQWIAAAQERLNKEKDVRTVLFQELEECESFVYRGNYRGALDLLNHVERSLTPEYDFKDLQERAATLRQKLSERREGSQPVGKLPVLWIAGISIFVLVAGTIFAFLFSQFMEKQNTSDRQMVVDEIERLIEAGQFREARKKLFLLEEKGMKADDSRYQQLESRLRSGEQEKGKSLLLEAETALNSGNTELANAKLKELETLWIPGFETQVAALKERIRQFADYTSTSEKTRTPLMSEIFHGNLERARLLIEQGADIDAADGNGFTVLMYAIWKAPDLVQELIQLGANVNTKDNRNVTALHVAADIGQVNSVLFLLSSGAELDVQNSFGATPLIVAATRGHTEIARLLIQAGADLAITTPNGYDALKTAQFYNHHEIASMIREELGASTVHKLTIQRQP